MASLQQQDLGLVETTKAPVVELPLLTGIQLVQEGKTGLPKVIKHGNLGEVIEATWNGTPCAIKWFTRDREQGSSTAVLKHKVRFTKHEMKQWAPRLRHPNVVQFLGRWKDAVYQSKCFGIVMERLRIDLNTFLIVENAAKRNIVSLEFKQAVLVDVTLALRYIHSLGLYHLDLNPSNVLLTQSLKAKLADFGITKDEDETSQQKATIACGNADFMPPEAEADAKDEQKRDFGYYTDVFSFGCLVISVLTHRWPKPLQKNAVDPVTRKVQERTEIDRRCEFLNDWEESEKAFNPLILSCLDENPKCRPNFDGIYTQLTAISLGRSKLPNSMFIHENLRQVFTSPAQPNSLEVEQPMAMPVAQSGGSPHRVQSMSHRWALYYVFFVLLAMVIAYVLRKWKGVATNTLI